MEIRGTTTLVGLLGWPTSHSLSPPMQNAGFAALGLDWAYVPLPTSPELADRSRPGSRRDRVCRCERDDPAQASGCRGVRRARRRRQPGRLGQHARVSRWACSRVFDRRCCRRRPDRGGRAGARLVLGAGGAARAVDQRARGRRERRRSWRRARDADWPPSTDGIDVVVNCTPIKDEVVVALRQELQVVDLAYRADGRDTALLAEARRARVRRRRRPRRALAPGRRRVLPLDRGSTPRSRRCGSHSAAERSPSPDPARPVRRPVGSAARPARCARDWAQPHARPEVHASECCKTRDGPDRCSR